MPGVKDGFTYKERMAIKELQVGTDVVDLTVDKDSIQYTVRVCLAVQEGKEYSQRFKTCPEVYYRVLRAGLKAVASGKQYGVFGQSSITIQGGIKRQSKQNFDDYPTQFKKQLKRHFDWKTRGDTTRIPVRENYSVAKLVESLEILAKAPDPSLQLAEQGADRENQEQNRTLKKRRNAGGTRSIDDAWAELLTPVGWPKSSPTIHTKICSTCLLQVSLALSAGNLV